GSSPGGEVAASGKPPVSGGSWSYTPPHQRDGTYTAHECLDFSPGHIPSSAPVTFSVDTTAPVVTLDALSSPTKDPTPALSGAARSEERRVGKEWGTGCEGSAERDKVAAFENVPVSGSWSYVPPQIGDGTY